ncbi:MAG: EscU/YscU/HrcU family type III secretion system export apparatus switch protein [Treponema sp.]
MSQTFIDLQWFAAEDEGKTEDPTEYRLRQAREKEGRVAKSQELNSTIVFFVNVILLVIMSPWIEQKLEEMLKFFFTNSTDSNVFDKRNLYMFLKYLIELTIPFALLGTFAAVMSNLIQNKGFMFVTKIIEPKFDKLVPHFGEYFKRTLFSFEGIFNVAKSIVKVIVLGIIAYIIINKNKDTLMGLIYTGGPRLALKQISSMTAQFLITSAIFLLIISVVDYIVQKRQFIERMKMSKQEVKQEYKDMDGDPEVKGHLEQAQREMLQQNIPKAVKESDVVITNPTHFAVSMKYKAGVDDAPKITAKGEDNLALNMKKIAYENDIPVIENRPLARGLYTDTKVGDIIPESYMKTISIVYAQIGYMNKNKKKM